MFFYVQNRKPNMHFLFGISSIHYLTTGGHTHRKKERLTELRKWGTSLSSLWSEEEENAGTKHSSSGTEPVLNIKNQFTVWLHSSTSLLCSPSVSELYFSRMCMDEVRVRSSLSKIHRVAICVWQSLHRTYLYFTFSPCNSFISFLCSCFDIPLVS